jgi:methanogenic corrinoid protein MtbC1
MRDEIARGRPAADAAAIVRSNHSMSSSQPLVDEFLQSAHRLDPVGVTRALDRARDLLGLERAVDEVLLPAMREIGNWWESGRCDVAHEHLATSTVSAWLSRAMLAGPPHRRSRPMILTCGPRDYHALGLECMGAILTERGWDCRLLGARVPADSLVTAITDSGATAAILVSHLSVGRRTAVDSLRAAQTTKIQLFYAGDAFLSRQSRLGVPGVYLGDNLSKAADLIARHCD